MDWCANHVASPALALGGIAVSAAIVRMTCRDLCVVVRSVICFRVCSMWRGRGSVQNTYCLVKK